jgi:hypothetical protein
MKRVHAANLIVSAFLISTAAGMQVVDVAEANFIPTVSVEISSPLNEKTYESTIFLNVTVNFYAWGNRSKNVEYSIDDSANNTLTGNLVDIDEISFFNGSVALPKLSDGKHCIIVYAWVDVESNPGFKDKATSEITFYTQANRQNHSASPITSPLTQQPTPTPSATPILVDPPNMALYYVFASLIASAIIITAFGVVYFKRRKT